VIDADPKGIGLSGTRALERKRDADYQTSVQMVANPALHKGVRALWKVYLDKYGVDYDPNGLAKNWAGKLPRSKVYDLFE
jgi:hypothetical protein